MLERSLEEGGDIRLQDSIYVWRSITQNPVASYIAFRYVRQNWDSIYASTVGAFPDDENGEPIQNYEWMPKWA
ncbi:Uncharacterized protein GBIM_15863 [Gryllus bimaculatus]|nr:Uncharacterized protein GBIM_15863 [Gryllus bimaculatus]